MSVKIRLTRRGKKNKPAFRIVATDSRTPRDGRNLEIFGHFNPSENPPSFKIDKERLEYWLSVGAQPTETVQKLIEGRYEFKPYEPKIETEEAET